MIYNKNDRHLHITHKWCKDYHTRWSRPLAHKDYDPLGAMQRHIEPAYLAFFFWSQARNLQEHQRWCWHPKSNLDPTALSMGLMFLLFLPPQPKPEPYFTARYAGAMGIIVTCSKSTARPEWESNTQL